MVGRYILDSMYSILFKNGIEWENGSFQIEFPFLVFAYSREKKGSTSILPSKSFLNARQSNSHLLKVWIVHTTFATSDGQKYSRVFYSIYVSQTMRYIVLQIRRRQQYHKRRREILLHVATISLYSVFNYTIAHHHQG